MICWKSSIFHDEYQTEALNGFEIITCAVAFHPFVTEAIDLLFFFLLNAALCSNTDTFAHSLPLPLDFDCLWARGADLRDYSQVWTFRRR